MSKSWKDFLLRSGIPLENDVSRFLDSRDCIPSFEYSYLRKDEYGIEKEFSYDIDAAYIKKNWFFDLMIECKYRHESTNWVFIPASYGGPGESYPNDFLHPFSHFISESFPYEENFPESFAPLCSKGIEITKSGDNEKSITQAATQLAYAYAPKLTSAIEHQVGKLLVHDFIFFHVPVIVTTAKLRRLNDDVDISSVKNAKELDEVSSAENSLIMKYTMGDHLQNYNLNHLRSFFESRSEKEIEKMQTFTKDISHFVNVIAGNYALRAIAIVHVSEDSNGMSSLLDYIDRLVDFPVDLQQKIQKKHEEIEIIRKEIDKKFKKPDT